MRKSKRRPNKYQRLISKFCKEPEKVWNNRGVVKREMAIAKKLFEYISEEKFWTKLYLPFKLNSLAWFLSDEGKTYLIKYKKNIDLKGFDPVVFQLGDEKVGEDKHIESKPKNLLDFLK